LSSQACIYPVLQSADISTSKAVWGIHTTPDFPRNIALVLILPQTWPSDGKLQKAPVAPALKAAVVPGLKAAVVPAPKRRSCEFKQRSMYYFFVSRIAQAYNSKQSLIEKRAQKKGYV
jgi:hypothetical protein